MGEAINARKAEVKAMGKDELAEVLKTKGLKIDKSKDTMGKTLLEHEANLRQQLQDFDRKMVEISAKKQEELEVKSNAELKEMCLAKLCNEIEVDPFVKEVMVGRILSHELEAGLPP